MLRMKRFMMLLLLVLMFAEHSQLGGDTPDATAGGGYFRPNSLTLTPPTAKSTVDVGWR